MIRINALLPGTQMRCNFCVPTRVAVLELCSDIRGCPAVYVCALCVGKIGSAMGTIQKHAGQTIRFDAVGRPSQ